LTRQNAGRSDNEARKILLSILDIRAKDPKPCLKASSVGWYGSAKSANVFNPETGKFDGPIESQAVCFTESTLAGL
jgi:NAD dependent epimerase/dehydratase family enzyme